MRYHATSLPSPISLCSGLLTFAMMKVLEQQEAVDDPTASSAVHLVGGVVGTIATGIFAKTDER